MKPNYHITRFSLIMFIQLFIILGLAGSVSAQTEDSIKSVPVLRKNEMGEIARILVGQKQFVTLPSGKGKENYKIEENAKEYTLPDTSSRVALFELPEFKQPYILVIRSLIHGFSTKMHLFIPSGAFLNKSFQPTSILADTIVFEEDPKLTFGVRWVNAVLMDENRKDDHYLFLYTHRRGDILGNYTNYNGGLIGLLVNHPIVATPDGKLEVEIIPFDTARPVLISNAQAKRVDVNLKRASIMALGKTKDDSVIPVLEEIVWKNNDDFGIRLSAIDAISTIQSKLAIESLTRVVQSNSLNENIRLYATEALAKMK